MTASWKLWTSLCHVSFTLLSAVALQQDLFLEPLYSAVLRGRSVRFQASTQRTWDLMTWSLGDVLVLTIHSDNTTTSFSEHFSATLCSDAGVGCVAFVIHDVTREQAGPVSCATLGAAGGTTAQLEVQESGSVLIVGGNRTAVQNDPVEFQCEAAAWFPAPIVTWTRNGNVLDSTLYATNSTPHGDSFNSISVLKFQADSSTTVRCLVTIPTLPVPRSSSVFLEVAAVPDWTVLIAVVVSVGGFALLVLLIIFIISCYGRRKERKSNSNHEVMRTSQLGAAPGPPGPRGADGTVNTAYVPDGHTSKERTHTSAVTHNAVTDGRSLQECDSSVQELPDVVGSSNNRADGNVVNLGFMKHRHVTIV